MPGPAGRHLAYVAASTIRETRVAIGWSQAELARRARTSQSSTSRIERGLIDRVDLGVIGRLYDALGCRLSLRVEAPFLSDRLRQREPAHAACVAYVAGRLATAGWEVRREVEIVDGRSHGWIDVLGYRPVGDILLVAEIKTQIEDVGQLERTLGWYEREAPSAARRIGWRTRSVVGAVIVLDTSEAAHRLRANREALLQTFPLPAIALRRCVDAGLVPVTAQRRAIAAIDPRSRETTWLRATVLEGSRRPARYADYAAFMRVVDPRGRRRGPPGN